MSNSTQVKRTKNERRSTDEPRLQKVLFTYPTSWGGETREETIQGEGSVTLARFGTTMITLESYGGRAHIRVNTKCANVKPDEEHYGVASSLGAMGRPDYVREDGTCTKSEYEEAA
jgi:hypothetical protein